MDISGHSQNHRIWDVMWFIEAYKPEYWKCVDPPADAAKHITDLGVKLLVRHNFPQPTYGWGSRFLDSARAQGWYSYCWGLETANEPFPGQDVPAWWVEEESWVVAQLRKDGIECVVGNRGVGHDGYYVPGAVYYGVHEYDWPYMLSNPRWNTLRFMDWFGSILAKTNLGAKLFITECGVTHATVPGNSDVGYLSVGMEPGIYWETSLLPYMQEISRYPYVLAAFIYQIGGLRYDEGDVDWSSFECGGTVIESLMLGQKNNPIEGEEVHVDTARVEFLLGVMWGIGEELASGKRIPVYKQKSYGKQVKDAVIGMKDEVLSQ